jgi:hypothetical protein
MTEGGSSAPGEGSPIGPYPSEFDAELCAAIGSARLEQASSVMDCRQVVLCIASDPHHGPPIVIGEDDPITSVQPTRMPLVRLCRIALSLSRVYPG